MNIITQIFSFSEYQLFKQSGINEFIIGLKDHSLCGELDSENLADVIHAIREKDSDCRLFLDFDLLTLEGDFERTAGVLKKMPIKAIDAVRVRDIGLASFITSELNHPVHLICESGVRNVEALKALREAIGPLVKRVVLPYEITGENLREWRQNLECEMEILGMGALRLFYSRRKLLSPLIPSEIPLQARCSTSFIRNRDLFEVIENTSGTQIYFSKDLALIPYWRELCMTGINSFRIDRFFNRSPELIEMLMNYFQNFDPGIFENLRKKWKKPWIHGFYQANHTGRNFESEQARRGTKSGEVRIGEVLEASKGNYLIACFDMKLCLPLKVILKTPLNQKMDLMLELIKNFEGNGLTIIEKDVPYFLPHVETVTAKTLILLGDS